MYLLLFTYKAPSSTFSVFYSHSLRLLSGAPYLSGFFNMMDVMVQTFVKDDKLCKRYAQFASDLDRWHFRIIYWFMFVLNLMILFVASWTYTKYVVSIPLIGLLRVRQHYALKLTYRCQ
jgi:hypothetical protein